SVPICGTLEAGNAVLLVLVIREQGHEHAGVVLANQTRQVHVEITIPLPRDAIRFLSGGERHSQTAWSEFRVVGNEIDADGVGLRCESRHVSLYLRLKWAPRRRPRQGSPRVPRLLRRPAHPGTARSGDTRR